MFKLVIFDWSGTLSDDLESCYKCQIDQFDKFGVPRITLEQYREEFFLPWSAYNKMKGIDWSTEEQVAWWVKNYEKYADLPKLFPETKPLLEKLREKNVLVAILSSHQVNEIHRMLKRNAIDEHFCVVKGTVEDKRREIHDILEQLGIKAEEALFVGDMVHDIRTARNAGVRVAVVSRGYTSKEKLEEAKPDYIFDSLEEVGELFE